MLSAVSAIHGGLYIDPEHQRIISELIQLGISPTYNKSTDKAKLERAKSELIEKIQSKNEENYENENNVYSIEDYYSSDEYSERARMEEERLGAMTIAELNRYFLVAS